MSYVHPHRIAENLINTTFLSVCLVLIGIGGLYISTIIRNAYTVLYPSALIFGAVCFLLLRRRNFNSSYKWEPNTVKCVLIAFFIVFFLLTAQYYEAGFWRTNEVFYLTFSLYTLVGIYIITGGETPVALVLICVAGLTTRITALYASSEYIGVDIYTHSNFIQSIVAEGTLETFATSKYFYAPLYHIQTAQGQLLFDVGTKEALTLTTMFSVVIVSALTVFVITNRLWNQQIALLASLLYTGSDEVINWTVHLIPTSLGIAFFSISVLSAIFYYTKRDRRMFVVFVGSIIALMFTHQVSLFITAVVIVAFFLAISAYTLQLPATVIRISLFTGFSVLLDFMVTKYAGPTGSQTFFQRILEGLISSVMTAGTDTRLETGIPADPTISLTGAPAMANIQLAGSSLLLLFAILGALFWLHRNDEPDSVIVALCLGVGVSMLLAFTLVFPLFGIPNLIPSRWWPFTYVLLAVLAAPGMMFLTKRVGSIFPHPRVAIPILLVTLLVPYVVLMGGAAAASADNPFIDDGFGALRYSITDTEQALGEHTNRYRSESIRIVSDTTYPYTSGTVQIDYNDPQSIASEDPILIANRAYMSKKQAMYVVQFEGRTIQVHGGVPIGELNPCYQSTLYDNGEEELLWVQRR